MFILFRLYCIFYWYPIYTRKFCGIPRLIGLKLSPFWVRYLCTFFVLNIPDHWALDFRVMLPNNGPGQHASHTRQNYKTGYLSRAPKVGGRYIILEYKRTKLSTSRIFKLILLYLSFVLSNTFVQSMVWEGLWTFQSKSARPKLCYLG